MTAASIDYSTIIQIAVVMMIQWMEIKIIIITVVMIIIRTCSASPLRPFEFRPVKISDVTVNRSQARRPCSLCTEYYTCSRWPSPRRTANPSAVPERKKEIPNRTKPCPESEALSGPPGRLCSGQRNHRRGDSSQLPALAWVRTGPPRFRTS